MTFSGPYEGIQRPYGRILAGDEKKSQHWLPTGDILLKVKPSNFTKDQPPGWEEKASKSHLVTPQLILRTS